MFIECFVPFSIYTIHSLCGGMYCFHILLIGLHCLNLAVQVRVVRHGCECLFAVFLQRLPLQVLHCILRTLRFLCQLDRGFVPSARACLRVKDIGSVCIFHDTTVVVITHHVVVEVPLEYCGPTSLHERHHAERCARVEDLVIEAIVLPEQLQ